MKKIMIILFAMILIVPIAIACGPGDRCTPYVYDYSVNPCSASGDVNTTSQIEVRVNGTACPSGIPIANCDVGPTDVRVNFWSNNGPYLNWVDLESLQDCTETHYETYCDNVSVRVIIHANSTNSTLKNDSGWSTTQMGYTGGVNDNVAVYGTSSNNGFETAGGHTIEIMVKSSNISENAHIIRLNYSIVDSADLIYGDCVGYGGKIGTLQSSVEDTNRIINSFQGDGTWGASMLYSLLVLIVGASMFLVTGGRQRGNNKGIAAGMTFIVVLLLVLFGTYLKLMNWTILAIFITCVVVYIVMKVRKYFGG